MTKPGPNCRIPVSAMFPNTLVGKFGIETGVFLHRSHAPRTRPTRTDNAVERVPPWWRFDRNSTAMCKLTIDKVHG